MIVNLRGTNGTGKSWTVLNLMDEYETKPIEEEGKIIGYHIPELDLGIVGRYETACGGCDGIKTAQGIEDRVYEFAGKFANVIFEGITVSHTFKRYNDLAVKIEEEFGHETVFMFITTPRWKCVSRIRRRRKEKGNDKIYDPTKILFKDYEQVLSTKKKLKEAGRNVVDLDWKEPLTQLKEVLGC